MAKGNNKKNKAGIAAVILICFTAVICTGIGFYHFSNQKAEKDTLLSSELSSEKQHSSTEASSSGTTVQTTENNDKENEADISAVEQANEYSLPLSINQALNALEEHYGNSYNINSTVEEDGYNYFAVYSGEEKYASVKVNLATGEASETIVSTGEKTDYYLV